MTTTLDDEGPCTDCDDTGITIQTERRCACQPPETATLAAVELLPCPNPWCEYPLGRGIGHHKRDGWRIVCACGVATPRFGSEAEAKLAWNTRTHQTDRAAVEALRASLADFLENPEFQVAVGGNPNMVDAMLERARERLAKYGDAK